MIPRLVLMAVLALAVAYAGQATLGSGGAREADARRARVVDVVDGDTVKVRVGDRRESVRLIGIDTPETYAGPECGGEQATAAMARRIRRGDRVRLVADGSQDDRDRYDRLLRYVERDRDGLDLGRAMVRDGWAEVYVFDAEFARLGAYRKSARTARREGAGVHERCGGDFDEPR